MAASRAAIDHAYWLLQEELPMKAVVVRTPAGLNNIDVVDIADPGQPGPGQIRVALHASSLNFHDLLVANGGSPHR